MSLVRSHLAQINIGRLRAPIDSPEITAFVAALEPINALAERSPGFVWRLQTADGNATAIRPFDDDSILVNMSVWESLEALRDYVYRSAHASFLRRRREWFQHMAEASLALWWVPVGHIPTMAEAVERLTHVQTHGPTPFAFTFRQPFPPPGASEPTQAPENARCPVEGWRSPPPATRWHRG